MYYNGQCTVVKVRNLPETLPDYQIARLWNSENGKGISVLLADNFMERWYQEVDSKETKE